MERADESNGATGPRSDAVIVMKFGGTSLGDADRIRSAARRVREARRAGRAPVVVVSAIAGTTDALEELVAHARSGASEGALAAIARLRALHLGLLAELGLEELTGHVERTAARLEDAVRGVVLLGECPARTRDAILASGELLSHRVVAGALRAAGEAAEAVDPRRVLRTDDRFGAARPDRAATRAAARERLVPLARAGVIPVVGGFVGATESGDTTVLGRGGSDLTATLLALALDAEEVEIWTDVDGMMTADPRVVPEARTLPELSFREASELAYFGARVLHPSTIRPAVRARIPVRVRSAAQPERPGTLVGPAELVAPPKPGTARAVAWKTGITMISLASGRMLGAHGFLASVFATFERHHTAVDVVTTSEVSVSVTVDSAERIDEITAELRELGTVRVVPDMAVVCLVGRGFLDHPELVSEVLGELAGFELGMFCLGSSDVNLTFVVHEAHAEEVVRRLHRRFLEGPAAPARSRRPAQEGLVR